MTERPKESGQFATRDAAIADAIRHMQPGEGLVVHEADCDTMYDRPCTCTPTVYHDMPEATS